MSAEAHGGEGRCPRASEGAAPPRGVPSSNTPPQTSNEAPFTGGEDWLEWSLYVDWLKEWGELQPRLAKAKEIAGNRQLARLTEGDRIMFGTEVAFVGPSGAHRGKAGKGLYMAYRFDVNGFSVQMASRPYPKRETPNVVIRAGGSQCLKLGGKACLDKGRELIASAGGTILREKLSRVDMCLDLPGVEMGAFVKAYLEKRFITRAKAFGYHQSTGITVTMGKHPLMLRIYDKAAQIRQERNVLKIFLMEARRWHGQFPRHATRVEFELGRQCLREHGIDTPDDYFAKRADLAAYLCREWVRLTAGPVNRENTARAETLPLWKAVEHGFLAWTGDPPGLPLEPLPTKGADVSQLIAQAAGVMITAAALTGRHLAVKDQFMAFVEDRIWRAAGKCSLEDEFQRRRARGMSTG